MKVSELINELGRVIPSDFALSFDNVGLLIGNLDSFITGIYVSLDINADVIKSMIDKGINTVITHHPIIFKPFKTVTFTKSNSKLLECIKNNINVICCHTNLDAIRYGINDELIKILGIPYEECLIFDSNESHPDVGIGRILKLKSFMSIDDIVDILRQRLFLDGIRVTGYDKCRKIKNICIINGSGNSLINSCFDKDIDLVITGDITYHTAFEAIENDLSIIDIGHFNSENMAYKSSVRKILDSFNLRGLNIVYDDVLKDVFTYII